MYYLNSNAGYIKYFENGGKKHVFHNQRRWGAGKIQWNLGQY